MKPITVMQFASAVAAVFKGAKVRYIRDERGREWRAKGHVSHVFIAAQETPVEPVVSAPYRGKKK